ncbi:Alcohol dehydrogenase GroES-like domain family protein [Aspergillus niger]|uniref:Alcohol dehydrogenase GroES-like domain family protein n=1 Tax=Aspergillus niger TaxID=5061 RepID=A0A505HYH8_ASPNG|nr:Alcohol dehydrogenase GroES-like domain family protein [Aspergillus niger]
MGKRNFADFSESPYTPHDRSQSLQLTRLFQKFEYGVMTLSKALKVARGFERQKLGRREKTAQKEEGEKKEGTLSRIAEEIQVVKTLDPHTTAEKYLFKQLLKTKRIAESPLFIAFKDKKKIAAEGPKSTAEANVTARLYKSTPVKNVFPGIMEGIRKLLGIEDKPAGGDVKGADKKAKDGKTKEKSTKEDKKKTKDDSEAKAKGSKASSTPATSTTFLPSLTMGGYWSGSEDEAEDGEAANEPPRRKNRMGQQARRALWEKKYGSGANHVKQEKNKRKAGGRDNGWDARRGATDGGDRWGRGGGPPAKKPEDNKPLHPSWEAARKAKEQKATAAFQGKKVTFD